MLYKVQSCGGPRREERGREKGREVLIDRMARADAEGCGETGARTDSRKGSKQLVRRGECPPTWLQQWHGARCGSARRWAVRIRDARWRSCGRVVRSRAVSCFPPVAGERSRCCTAYGEGAFVPVLADVSGSSFRRNCEQCWRQSAVPPPLRDLSSSDWCAGASVCVDLE